MRRYYLINTESGQPKEQRSSPIVFSTVEKPRETEKLEEQRVWPNRPTVYPNGVSIPDSLPNSYLPSQSCGNCAAYDAKTTICSTYDAPVLTSYWCRSWRAK